GRRLLRRCDDPRHSMPLLEPPGHPERPDVWTNDFPHQEDLLVTRHLLVERLRYCFQIGDFLPCLGFVHRCRHRVTSSSLAKTPSNVSGPSGRGLFSANSTPASTSFFTRSSTSRKCASSA